MDVYIARQPIFDNQMNIFGYELLYRKGEENYFIEMDDDQATTELIVNSFLVVGLNDLTGGTKAFINFSKDMISSDIPYLLPKDRVVCEILERKEATQATVDACEKLRSMGYTLALDDFVMDESFLPLIDKVDIIKVEYPSVSLSDQRSFIQEYRAKSKVKFLAEKIETREEYQLAVEMGYDYFQGYFFSKPAIVNSKEIKALNINLMNILQELNKDEPSFPAIAEIIQRDLGLTYKILTLANSAFMGARQKIDSISQALSFLGIREITQWVSLMMFKDLENVENSELIKLSLIRGKLMERIAVDLRYYDTVSEFFFTGMFSMVDVLMNKPMYRVMDGLPFPEEVKQALMGEGNDLRRLLNFVIGCESGNWNKDGLRHPFNSISLQRYSELYMEALRWANNLNY